jgi:hypothetical protein
MSVGKCKQQAATSPQFNCSCKCKCNCDPRHPNATATETSILTRKSSEREAASGALSQHGSHGWLRIALPSTTNSPQFLNSIAAAFQVQLQPIQIQLQLQLQLVLFNSNQKE